MSYLTPKVVTKEVKQESMLQSEQSSMPAETLIPLLREMHVAWRLTAQRPYNENMEACGIR